MLASVAVVVKAIIWKNSIIVINLGGASVTNLKEYLVHVRHSLIHKKIGSFIFTNMTN